VRMRADLSKRRTAGSCGASQRSCGECPQSQGRSFTIRRRTGFRAGPRYIDAVLRILAVSVALVACGPRGTDVKSGGGGAGGGGRVGSGSGSATPDATRPPGSAPDVGCLTPTCAYHAGANSYFTCLSSGAGTCFHFG